MITSGISAVDTGLSAPNAPVSNMVRAGNMLFTVQLPRDPQTGLIDTTGDIEAQTELTLQNLTRALRVADADLTQVCQITVYLVEAADMAGMNKVYARFFQAAPFPNRATVIVSSLAQPGMRIEMLIQAFVG